MIQDRALVRAAFPQGYLNMAGVYTMGGGMVWGVGYIGNPVGSITGAPDFYGFTQDAKRIEQGDYLPMVCAALPHWHLLLANLGCLVWPGEVVDRVAIRGAGAHWRVVGSGAGRAKGLYRGVEAHYAIEATDDVEVAFCRLRALVVRA